MLRRSLKLKKCSDTNDKSVKCSGSSSKRALTDSILEAEVFGGHDQVATRLDEFTSSKSKRKKEGKDTSNLLKPVWVDDDPTISTELCSKISKPGQKWAQLPGQRTVEHSAASDTESENEAKIECATGDYLELSSKLTCLPSGILHFKKRKDVNADRPAKGKLRSVEYHRSSQILLTAGMDQTLRLFQVDGQNNPVIQSVFIETFPIYTAQFSRDGSEVILGSRHKSFYSYDLIAGKVVNVPRIKAMDGCPTKRFLVSPDGQHIAFLGRYGNIHLVTAKSKEYVCTLKMNGEVESLAFTDDGCKMFSHGAGNEVYVWDIRRRVCCHKFIDDGCGTCGTSVAVSPGNQYVATGSDTGVVNIYDMEASLYSCSPAPLKAVQNLTTSCTVVKFNATSEILAIASGLQESAIRLVHLPSLTVFSNFPERSDNIRIPLCLDWSLNSGYLAVGNHKGCALQYRLKHYANY